MKIGKHEIYHTRNIVRIIDESIIKDVIDKRSKNVRRNLLHEWRRMKGITQEQVAEALNIHRLPTYVYKEQGITEFTLSEAYELSRLLEVNLDELYLALTSYRQEE